MMTWDPPNTLFTIPFLNLDIRIYGLLFALGFVAGYFIMRNSLTKFLNSKDKARQLTDRLTTYCIFGCVIGARLGHVLFYDVDYYLAAPSKILKVWEGGLASHGGAVGVLIAFFLYWRLNRRELNNISFLKLFDFLVVPVAFVGFMIRMGNFFNQEILGDATDMPWGITFLHAIDGGNDFARHPVQLYEALFCLLTFCVLKRIKPKVDGIITGWFFLMIFGSRFLIEFFKSSQGGQFDDFFLQTGQLLSLPFIIAGVIMLACLSGRQSEDTIKTARNR